MTIEWLGANVSYFQAKARIEEEEENTCFDSRQSGWYPAFSEKLCNTKSHH